MLSAWSCKVSIPSRAKKNEQQERLATILRSIAEEYVARIEKEGRAEKTIFKTNWLLNFACPILGDLRIKEIEAARSCGHSGQ